MGDFVDLTLEDDEHRLTDVNDAAESGDDLVADVDTCNRQPSGPNTISDLREQVKTVDKELSKVEVEISRLLAKQAELRKRKQDLSQLLQAEQTAPRKDWTKDKFPWDQQANQLLKTVFRLDNFRPLQREVINASLQGRDVLCLLPSGGGKSLCYQLPALIHRPPPGLTASAAAVSTSQPSSVPDSGSNSSFGALGRQLTLVVSPLLSLIQDQVACLKAFNIQAAALTSLSSKEETAAVFNSLAPYKDISGSNKGSKVGKKRTKAESDDADLDLGNASTGQHAQQQGGALPVLLYVTPERVVSSKRLMAKLEKLYEAGQLARIAVDEAHCASQWGNDFRPDYKKLGILRTMFPKVPILALTATATHQVQQDICRILSTPGAELFAASINRPNLCYQVALKPSTGPEASQALVSWIATNYPNGESGIVYALTRKDCEAQCNDCVSGGIKAVHYHADMDPMARQAAHQRWSSGRVQVVVATIAFGMGINKPDVRFVVHASLSKSVENYYQESGRAGRDGLPARCLLFYRFSDALRQAAIVCYEPNWWHHLQGMMQYSTHSCTHGCRRAALQAHFSEAPAQCKAMCDVCMRKAAAAAAAAATTVTGGHANDNSGEDDVTDVTKAVACILRAISTLPQTRGTLIQVIDAWKKIDKPGAKDLGREGAEQVVEAMLLRGLLQLDFGATAYQTNVYLTLSNTGREALVKYQSILGDREGSAEGSSDALTPQHNHLIMKVSIKKEECNEDDEGSAGSNSAADRRWMAKKQILGAAQRETWQHAERAVRAWAQHEAQRCAMFPESLMCEDMIQAVCHLVATTQQQAFRKDALQQVLRRGGPHLTDHLQSLYETMSKISSDSYLVGKDDHGSKHEAAGSRRKGGRNPHVLTLDDDDNDDDE